MAQRQHSPVIAIGGGNGKRQRQVRREHLPRLRRHQVGPQRVGVKRRTVEAFDLPFVARLEEHPGDAEETSRRLLLRLRLTSGRHKMRRRRAEVAVGPRRGRVRVRQVFRRERQLHRQRPQKQPAHAAQRGAPLPWPWQRFDAKAREQRRAQRVERQETGRRAELGHARQSQPRGEQI